MRFAAFLSSFVAVAAAPAQLSPFSGQIQVNTATTGYQTVPGIATDAIGNVIIVWSSEGPLGTDTSGSSIRARRFDADDPAPWMELQINAYTTGAQDQPAIAPLSTGGFVVVWESFGSPGDDSDQSSIQGQLVDIAGGNVGPQFQVNTSTTGFQKLPVVAGDGVGNFVVAWQSSPGIGSPYQIVGRKFDSAGVPDDAEFAISTVTSVGQYFPSIAGDADGDFVVAWSAAAPIDPDTSGSSIRARVLDSNNPDPDFTVNHQTSGAQTSPSVAMSPEGDFLVVWQTDDHAGVDTLGTGIRGRTFDASGAPMFGNDFEINAFTTGDQSHPLALRDTGGDFIVVWEGSESPGTDHDGSSLHGRRIVGDTLSMGPESQINVFTTGDVFAAAIAPFPDGGFAVTWSGYGSPGDDSDESSIQARGYDALFADGFNAGNLVRWSFWAP